MAGNAGYDHEIWRQNYTIFLDRETLVLYGYIEVEDPAKWDESADTAVNRQWWISWLILWRRIRITALFRRSARGIPSGLRKKRETMQKKRRFPPI